MSNVLPLHRSGDRGQGALVEDLATLDRSMNPLVAAQIAFDQLDVVECGRLLRCPVEKLSRTLTVWPSRSSSATRLAPMKPALR
jgi:hypothetical protein